MDAKPHSAAAGPTLYTISEAAKLLRMNREVLRRMCRKKRIGFSFVARKYLFRPEHLDAFVRRHEGRR